MKLLKCLPILVAALLTITCSVPRVASQSQPQPWNAGANIAPVMTNAPSALFPNAQVVDSNNPLPKEQGGSGDSSGAIPGGAHVVTSDDESGSVPNARQFVDGTNTTVDLSTPNQIKINASGGGGGGGLLLPPSFIDVPALHPQNPVTTGLLVSPDGAFIYMGGTQVASPNAGIISKVNSTTGAVVASISNGANSNNFQSLALSPDGAFLYAIDTNPNPPIWHKIDTTTMTSVHSQALVGLPTNATGGFCYQGFDLSPDGGKYNYIVGGADDNVYSIDTSTYVETSIATGHSDGGTLGAAAVGFYNGSSTDFYVAYVNNANLDLYSSGTYSSTVDTGLTGTKNIAALRSGVNGTIFAMNAQGATTTSVVAVNSGTPTIFPVQNPIYLAVNLGTSNSLLEADDICAISANFSVYLLDHYGAALHSLPVPSTIDDWNQGLSQTAWQPGKTGQLMALSGATSLQAWSVATIVPLDAAGPAGNIQVSDGKGKWISQTPAANTQSPFGPAGFANVSTFNNWFDVAISPDGQYAFVSGGLTTNGHDAVAKIKISDGSIAATCDLGTFNGLPIHIAVSPDGTSLYLGVSSANVWYHVHTSGMTLVHTSTLAAAATPARQAWDLSPDGSKYVFCATSTSLHIIDTSTYAETTQAMTHTAGNLASVCFYNGSNINVYVAHAGSAVVDLYAIGGAYTSSVNTTAGGTPAFNAMRSGINNTFFIADRGTNNELIQVSAGTPTIVPTGVIGSITTNTLSPTAISDGIDIAYMQTNGSFFQMAGVGIAPLNSTSSVLENGASGIALLPGSSENIFTLSGVNYPEVWSLGSGSPTGFQVTGAAGSVSITNPSGFPLFTTVSGDITINGSGVTVIKSSVALAGSPTTTTQTAGDNSQKISTTAYVDASLPHSPPGYSGAGTLSSGTATITCGPCTTTSIIGAVDTGSSLVNVGSLQIRTKNNGSFVIDSTNTLDASTFDWWVVKP